MDGDDDQLDFDDGEDEFGLPSVASSRASTNRNEKSSNASKGTTYASKLSSTNSPGFNHLAADGPEISDIAELRGGPTYPSTNRGEGKILRPQYKEILRGRWPLNQLLAAR